METLMETVWKWLLRFMYTVTLLLVMTLLALGIFTIPRLWDAVEKLGGAAGTVENAARSIQDASEKAYDALDSLED